MSRWFSYFRINFFMVAIFLSLVSFKALHKFYVSVTQVEYVEDKKAVQIILRVFIDDIESVLNERYATKLRLDPKKQQPVVEKYLKKYLSDKFILKINNENRDLDFLGIEYENDLLLCYLEIEDIPEFYEIKIENTILMDLFEEQQNIVHVKYNKQKKSLILQEGKSEGMLKFSK